MNDPRYSEGILLFQQRRWFECHEVLELLWRDTPAGTTRTYLQGLIQLAVSLEHWRRNNPRGAWGQWEKARAKLDPLPPIYAGLQLGPLLADFATLWSQVDLLGAVERQGATHPAPVALPPVEESSWPTPRWQSSPPGPAT